MNERKIIHIDMDCFYAAVEVRDAPELRGKAVAVGGLGPRSVVATCNYEARKFGVHSALAMKTALQRCPELIVIPPNMAKYKEESHKIREIFSHYSDKIEPISLDEAYLDVTQCTLNEGSATLTAHQIRTEIYETTGLTASAGIGPNKLIAKIASDWRKPNGQFTVPPDQTRGFISQLPIGKIWGIGKVTQRKLNDQGIFMVAELLNRSKQQLIQEFGQFGQSLYGMIRGRDDREVNVDRKIKSVSTENTFAQDLRSYQQKKDQIELLVEQLYSRLQQNSLLHRIKKCSLKIRNCQFETHSAEVSTTQFSREIYSHLFEKLYARDKLPIRLIGVSVGIKNETHMDCELNFENQRDL